MKDGGPAFPVKPWINQQYHKDDCGMSLRDYFAALAMQGFCADPETNNSADKFAAAAYAMADAMLLEREKLQGEVK